jgi:1-acyl-sn-glycerol-3-phosphate acyltransferase
MSLTVQDIAGLPLDTLRAALPDWVVSHAALPSGRAAGLRAELRAVVAGFADDQLEDLRAAFAVAGDEYRFYAAHPVARAITRLFMPAVLPGASAGGLDRLDAFWALPGRRLIVCNHLSYADTQVTDALLHVFGRSAIADRLVAIAGPKVYTEPWRRMATVALNTRKTAQSIQVATEQDSVGARQLALIALETIADCTRRMDEGWIPLLYPEGTRSRTGALQPFLRAAGRYLAIPELSVLPMAQVGTENVFPIDATTMAPAPVTMRFGDWFPTSGHPGKTGALDEAWSRVAALVAVGPAAPA